MAKQTAEAKWAAVAAEAQSEIDRIDGQIAGEQGCGIQFVECTA